MTYGYIRVSSDRQTVENQRYEIARRLRCSRTTLQRFIAKMTKNASISQF